MAGKTRKQSGKIEGKTGAKRDGGKPKLLAGGNPQKTLGLIGQQVQEVEPSLVTDGSVVTVNYAGLSVVAIGAIQELYELVQEQEREIERLRHLVEGGR